MGKKLKKINTSHPDYSDCSHDPCCASSSRVCRAGCFGLCFRDPDGASVSGVVEQGMETRSGGYERKVCESDARAKTSGLAKKVVSMKRGVRANDLDEKFGDGWGYGFCGCEDCGFCDCEDHDSCGYEGCDSCGYVGFGFGFGCVHDYGCDYDCCGCGCGCGCGYGYSFCD